jgi:two-component system response regulator VicR
VSQNVTIGADGKDGRARPYQELIWEILVKIVIIEDAADIVEVVSLCFELRWPGSEVISSAEGKRGLELIERENPDIVILDLGLPDIDGFEVLKDIRRFSNVPVIVLTARTEEVDIVRGLELGADDYITKPFSHIQLLARVQSVLRRVQSVPRSSANGYFSIGDLYIDFDGREVRLAGQTLQLTPIEYNLLYQLVCNEGRVLSHRYLLEKVWGAGSAEDDISYIKVYVQRLCDKLKDSPQTANMIQNVRGVGYKFAKSEK